MPPGFLRGLTLHCHVTIGDTHWLTCLSPTELGVTSYFCVSSNRPGPGTKWCPITVCSLKDFAAGRAEGSVLCAGLLPRSWRGPSRTQW